MIAFADFSGDETLCLAISLIIAGEGLARLYLPIFSIPLLGRSTFYRLILASVPAVGLSMAGIVLCRWADVQVVGHAGYICLFLIVGAAILAVSFRALTILGISVRNDVVDRNNPAALAVSVGAILAVAIIYALANVGGGPTIWTTILPAAEAGIVLFGFALLIELLGFRVFEAVTIDRDVAAGVRLAGALVGCGIVLGRSAGGVWFSAAQSLVDLGRYGWPAVIIATAAGVVHRRLRWSSTRPRPLVLTSGIIPGVVFVGGGIAAVFFMPHGMHLSQW